MAIVATSASTVLLDQSAHVANNGDIVANAVQKHIVLTTGSVHNVTSAIHAWLVHMVSSDVTALHAIPTYSANMVFIALHADIVLLALSAIMGFISAVAASAIQVLFAHITSAIIYAVFVPQTHSAIMIGDVISAATVDHHAIASTI